MTSNQDLSDPIAPERMIAFSDAVVAIAITLLILPLVGLKLPEGDPNPLQTIWTNNYALILSFLITWAVIISFWLTHNRLFRMFENIDQAVILWNLVWLFAIIVLPFPMNLANQLTDNGNSIPINSVTAFYIGTMAVLSISLTMMQRETRRRPDLLTEAARLSGPRNGFGSWAMAGYLVLLTLLAFFIGNNILYALLGLPLIPWLDSFINQPRRQQAHSESAAQSE